MINTTTLASRSSSSSTSITDFYSSLIPYLTSLSKSLNFYVTVCFLLPGVFLNVFTACVFASRSIFWQRSTFGYYYTLYATAAACYVGVGVLTFFPVSFAHDFTLVSVPSCRALWYFRIFFSFGSNWVNKTI